MNTKKATPFTTGQRVRYFPDERTICHYQDFMIFGLKLGEEATISIIEQDNSVQLEGKTGKWSASEFVPSEGMTCPFHCGDRVRYSPTPDQQRELQGLDRMLGLGVGQIVTVERIINSAYLQFRETAPALKRDERFGWRWFLFKLVH